MRKDRIEHAIRPYRSEDLPELCDLVNEIIRIGGTTLLETPFTVSGFVDHFFNQQIMISCLVAEDEGGQILGFQVLSYHEQLPDDWADISTFVRASPRLTGVGTALFAETAALAERYDLAMLSAIVRAGNVGGLAYYEKMGFVPRKIEKNVPLASGGRCDRVFMQYAVPGDHNRPRVIRETI